MIVVCLNINFLSLAFTQFKVLMEHLDPDEEDEEGEASASANIRNKAINALLGGSAPLSGPSPRNQAGPETDDDDSDGDERTPGVRSSNVYNIYGIIKISNILYFKYFFPLSVHAVISEVKASRRLLGPRPDE